jgi:hypothetical protein
LERSQRTSIRTIYQTILQYTIFSVCSFAPPRDPTTFQLEGVDDFSSVQLSLPDKIQRELMGRKNLTALQARVVKIGTQLFVSSHAYTCPRYRFTHSQKTFFCRPVLRFSRVAYSCCFPWFRFLLSYLWSITAESQLTQRRNMSSVWYHVLL